VVSRKRREGKEGREGGREEEGRGRVKKNKAIHYGGLTWRAFNRIEYLRRYLTG
jgi:hypothetical protein